MGWGDDGYFDTEHFLQNSRQCLPSGDYKVEIFINGRLAASKVEEDVDTGDLVAAYVLDVGAGFCVPRDWSFQTDLPGTGPRGMSGPSSGI